MMKLQSACLLSLKYVDLTKVLLSRSTSTISSWELPNGFPLNLVLGGFTLKFTY
jgi:hypothetical protein